MPRTLPWLKNAGGSSTSTSRPNSNEARNKRNHDISSRDDNKTPVKKAARASRTPSTSPPPVPPDVEFMREGDDGWMMVEDEFLSVAQAFTRHLHHAEYQRLKRIAMRKNQDASKSITRSRVTNANQSKSSVKRMEIESKSRAVTKHTEEVLDEMGADEAARDEIDDSDDSDRVAIGDKQLAGLMYGEDSPTARRQLSSVTGASGKSKTRAAAGFGSNSSIDAQRIAPTSSLESGHSQGIGKANYTNQTVPSSHTHSISTVDNPAIEDLASRSRRMENSGTKASISKLSMVNIPAKTEPREGKGEEDGNLPAKPLVNPHGPSLMARRKARAAKKRKEAVSKDDEIPMFLG